VKANLSKAVFTVAADPISAVQRHVHHELFQEGRPSLLDLKDLSGEVHEPAIVPEDTALKIRGRRPTRHAAMIKGHSLPEFLTVRSHRRAAAVRVATADRNIEGGPCLTAYLAFKEASFL
jgi:hypothetical protein